MVSGLVSGSLEPAIERRFKLEAGKSWRKKKFADTGALLRESTPGLSDTPLFCLHPAWQRECVGVSVHHRKLSRKTQTHRFQALSQTFVAGVTLPISIEKTSIEGRACEIVPQTWCIAGAVRCKHGLLQERPLAIRSERGPPRLTRLVGSNAAKLVVEGALTAENHPTERCFP